MILTPRSRHSIRTWMNPSGDNTMCVLPSRQGVLSFNTYWPAALVYSRPSARAARDIAAQLLWRLAILSAAAHGGVQAKAQHFGAQILVEARVSRAWARAAAWVLPVKPAWTRCVRDRSLSWGETPAAASGLTQSAAARPRAAGDALAHHAFLTADLDPEAATTSHHARTPSPQQTSPAGSRMTSNTCQRDGDGFRQRRRPSGRHVLRL